MQDGIQQLVALSRRYGGDPSFVLAGGGNTSFKTSDRLWVKASGHALATIDADGFVEMDRAALDAMLRRSWPEDHETREAAFQEAVMAARVEPERGQRPSVEALLHHLMPGKFVVHTHPSAINGIACCTCGEALTTELMPEAIWQPYVNPGVTLAQSLYNRLVSAPKTTRGDTQTCVVLLENHGLIVSDDHPEQIENQSTALLEATDRRFLDAVSAVGTPPADQAAAATLELHGKTAAALFPNDAVETGRDEALAWLSGTETGKQAALSGPMTPDQIVYCRSFPAWIEQPADEADAASAQWRGALDRYASRYGGEPWVVLLAGVGAVLVRESPKLAKVTRAIYADAAAVSRRAAALGGAQALSDAARAFVEDWEVETYRRQIAADNF